MLFLRLAFGSSSFPKNRMRLSLGERLATALVLPFIVSACGTVAEPPPDAGPPAPAPSCDLIYTDTRCSNGVCTQTGDGKCYRRCSIEDPCPDGLACRELGYWAATDKFCTKTESVCQPYSASYCGAK